MTIIISGKEIADKKLAILKEKIQKLERKPCLAIILIGDNASSKIYVENKVKAAINVGIKTKLIELDSSISTLDLLSKISSLNSDKEVDGIIVQLPLPNHISSSDITLSIDPKKDVDGFHPTNVGLLYSGREPLFAPCTPIGILELLKDQFEDLSGLHAVIIGRSNIVGRPLASLLLKNDLTVTICHSKTQDLKKHTKTADIVIAASGKMLLFGKDCFSEKTVVIDVGISRTLEGKTVGDVLFDDVYGFVKAITKVPGGVGPMTIVSLLENVLKASTINN